MSHSVRSLSLASFPGCNGSNCFSVTVSLYPYMETVFELAVEDIFVKGASVTLHRLWISCLVLMKL